MKRKRIWKEGTLEQDGFITPKLHDILPEQELHRLQSIGLIDAEGFFIDPNKIPIGKRTYIRPIY